MLISIKVVKSLRVGIINIKTARKMLIHDIMQFIYDLSPWDVLDEYGNAKNPDFFRDIAQLVDTLDFVDLIDFIEDAEGSEKIIQKIENYKKLVV